MVILDCCTPYRYRMQSKNTTTTWPKTRLKRTSDTGAHYSHNIFRQKRWEPTSRRCSAHTLQRANEKCDQTSMGVSRTRLKPSIYRYNPMTESWSPVHTILKYHWKRIILLWKFLSLSLSAWPAVDFTKS